MGKIAVLMGSPRRNGNTAKLVESFVMGANKAGNEVEVIRAATLNINGCLGCNACITNGHKCVQKDDMQSVYDRLKDVEVIVIATPIYFYGVSSQLKCLIDRLHNPVRNDFSVKKLALLCVCADTIPTVFDSIKEMYESVLRYFSLEDGGMVTVNGVNAIGDIFGNVGLSEAEQLGLKI